MSDPTTGPQPVRPKGRPVDPTATGDLADAVVPPRKRSTGSTSKTTSRSTKPAAAPKASGNQQALIDDVAAVSVDAPELPAPVQRQVPRTTVTGAGPSVNRNEPAYGQPTSAAAPVQPNNNTRGMPRRVRLRVTRIGPGTVAQVTFLITAMLAIASLVAVTILWFLLTKSGVLTNSQSLANAIFGTATTQIDLTKVFSLPRLLLLTAIWSVFQVVVVTFFAWLLAIAYNAIVKLTGGVELTLADHA